MIVWGSKNLDDAQLDFAFIKSWFTFMFAHLLYHNQASALPPVWSWTYLDPAIAAFGFLPNQSAMLEIGELTDLMHLVCYIIF
jgi:hypothetical protein